MTHISCHHRFCNSSWKSTLLEMCPRAFCTAWMWRIAKQPDMLIFLPPVNVMQCLCGQCMAGQKVMVIKMKMILSCRHLMKTRMGTFTQPNATVSQDRVALKTKKTKKRCSWSSKKTYLVFVIITFIVLFSFFMPWLLFSSLLLPIFPLSLSL